MTAVVMSEIETKPIRAHLVTPGDLLVHRDRLYRVHRAPVKVLTERGAKVSIELLRSDGFGGWVESPSYALVPGRRDMVSLVVRGVA